jgi:hypothetical protein
VLRQELGAAVADRIERVVTFRDLAPDDLAEVLRRQLARLGEGAGEGAVVAERLRRPERCDELLRQAVRLGGGGAGVKRTLRRAIGEEAWRRLGGAEGKGPTV